MQFPYAGMAACLWALAVIPIASPLTADELTPLQILGKRMFFDTKLSTPAGQSCASCHGPAAGFTSPDSTVNDVSAVHPGALKTVFGNRKPPSAAYAAYSPQFKFDKDADTYVGGQFWDGRARDLADQATKPLLNPLEQNSGGAGDLLRKLSESSYRKSFEHVFGRGTLEQNKENETRLLGRMAAAIAAYEASAEVNPFSSKYDAYLAGKVKLSKQEARGLDLYAGKANCFSCHPHKPGPDGKPPLFTDYTYDNLGIPRNPNNPFYRMPKSVNPAGEAFLDLGLGGVLNDPKQHGKFKVPTLRNVDRRPERRFVKAFGHNGYFKSLNEIVHFYNVRDAGHEKFPAPEVPQTVNHKELGNLGLSDQEEGDLVAFLKTLSDGYQVAPTVHPAAPETAGDAAPAVSSDHPSNFEAGRDMIRVMRFREHLQRMADREKATSEPRR